ncbi:hypothetical protein DCAR_0520079 [Daucus carota subsp. sativus]|uniref:TF-B3 domain-containing protein n=1 Tax=Daucus carota subsp. sativus TaxID=79200 RepID=A0AAF0X3E6_DAUCS|nr:hypothetical protein DCAR_0520079 [Daucus carota subsp. sativus]
MPERLLLLVPGKVVWNALFRKDRSWIEGLEKMMIFYCIKPYYMLIFEYVGGPSFNLEIYNPYGVEINYWISPKSDEALAADRSFFEFSDLEIDKLCGTLSHNVYNNGSGLYDLLVNQNHLRKKEYYKILKRKACRKLGLDETMEKLKLCLKNLVCKLKLIWNHGKVYFDRKWYALAKAWKLKEGDTVVFQMTGKKQKFEICVYDNDILSKCNTSGRGKKTGVMNWFKFVNESFLRGGQMEIPRVFMQSGSASFSEKVELITRDGESSYAEFCPRRNFLTGMRDFLRRYAVDENDVIVFQYVKASTFAVSLFKFSGMEFKYNCESTIQSTTVNNVPQPDIILISDSSVDIADDGMEEIGNEDPENNLEADFEEVEDINIVSFQVTLKRSHVDKKCHGVYLPKLLYSAFKSWRSGTNIRLLSGDDVYNVSVLRSNRQYRLGSGWTDFTVGNEFEEGQTIQMDYVHEKTFRVTLLE